MTEETKQLRHLIKDAVEELEDRFDEIQDTTADSDINEIAEGCVPVHYFDVIELTREDMWLATEEPQLYCFDGKHTAVNAIAGNAYDEILQALWTRYEELKEEREEERKEGEK